MVDIFIELDYINWEINSLKSLLIIYDVYFSDILEKSYSKNILFANIELCLEHMDFSEYTKVMSEELKSLLNDLIKDKSIIEEKLKELEELKNKYINMILSLVNFSYLEFKHILELFNIECDLKEEAYISSILIECNGMLVVNKLLENFINEEVVDFIRFYINTKVNFAEYSIDDVYKLYKEERLNLV